MPLIATTASASAKGYGFEVSGSVTTTSVTGVSGSAFVGVSQAIIPAVPGSELRTAPTGAQPWVVPAGVASISVVCVGAGGGGAGKPNVGVGGGGAGGGLVWANDIPVTPGETLTTTVLNGGLGGSTGGFGADGGDTTLARGATILVRAFGGFGGTTSFDAAQGRSGFVNAAAGAASIGLNVGGNGSTASSLSSGRGGGGAAGYSGSGGNAMTGPAPPGGGGAGGSQPFSSSTAYGQGGGGVGIFGEGASGATFGKGGSGGTDGDTGQFQARGGSFGGGAGSSGSGVNNSTEADRERRRGRQGALYIVWPGTRSFPSNL